MTGGKFTVWQEGNLPYDRKEVYRMTLGKFTVWQEESLPYDRREVYHDSRVVYHMTGGKFSIWQEGSFPYDRREVYHITGWKLSIEKNNTLNTSFTLGVVFKLAMWIEFCWRGVTFWFFKYSIQHCVFCCPSDSTVSEDAGIKPNVCIGSQTL